ncbi:SIS domain-containing protein [Bacteroidota bacterium]
MISERISESIQILNDISNDQKLLEKINQVVSVLINCFNQNKKVLFCGNGGSASDAQHLAAELSGRFYLDRKPLPAEALHVNTSYITAVANDYSFDEIYSRYITGFGQEGDVLVGLSTSGNSANVVEAFKTAIRKNIITVGLTGKTGGKLKKYSDIVINVPSSDTPRIQEAHILIGHIICELVENKLFGEH